MHAHTHGTLTPVHSRAPTLLHTYGVSRKKKSRRKKKGKQQFLAYTVWNLFPPSKRQG